MKKGRPFFEIFASAAHEDYRFPVLELFAFLYMLGTFAFVSTLVGMNLTSDEHWVFWLISDLMAMPLFVFIILIFKNIAYGLGGDLEKGTIQTYLSYPIKRRNILTAKLLSAIGIALLLFFSVQISTLLIIAPNMTLSNISLVLLSYVAHFGYVFFLTAVVLLIALVIKRGGIALIVGVVVYFALGIIANLVLVVTSIMGSALPLQIVSLLNPSTALSARYGGLQLVLGNFGWEPGLSEVAVYVVGNYVITAVLFLLAYYYFCRRLSI